MLMKVLFWGILVSASLFLICFLIITISAIIYGYGDGITSDPADSRIENGTVRYMEKAKYEIYRLVMGKVHLTGWSCGIIMLILSILREYIMKRSSS